MFDVVAHRRGRGVEDPLGGVLLIAQPHDEDGAQVLGHHARAGVLEEEARDPLAEGALGERAHGVARARVVEHVVLASPDRQVKLRQLGRACRGGATWAAAACASCRRGTWPTCVARIALVRSTE